MHPDRVTSPEAVQMHDSIHEPGRDGKKRSGGRTGPPV